LKLLATGAAGAVRIRNFFVPPFINASDLPFLGLLGVLALHIGHNLLPLGHPLFPVIDGILEILMAGYSENTTLLQLLGKRNLASIRGEYRFARTEMSVQAI
jgi:hypothetical protein